VAERLAFAPEILRRLGEELVPHPDQGIIELVRNAYDADATTCLVQLNNVDDMGGSITVIDNGNGMTKAEIANGWLVLGRSSKNRKQQTRLGRTPAGDKGLGRLAALRLGTTAVLRTRPRTRPGREYSLVLDWNIFDASPIVEQVPLKIESTATTDPPGTTVELLNLRVRLRRTDVHRLARALLLLSDPFESATGFRPSLSAPSFSELEKLVRSAYFDDVEYRVHAELDKKGFARAEILDWRGTVLRSADHGRLVQRARPKRTGPYNAPSATFDLWAFNLSGEAFSTRSAGVSEVREWLAEVGGVHVYQHELRVPPYGDAGVDWLDMNLRRVRSPEARPSTNNSIGRVVVADDESLVQKTDRTGFVQNEAFTELRAFAIDVLDWVATERLRDAERRREAAKHRAERESRSTETDAETVAETLAVSGSTEAAAAFRRYQSALRTQLESLREDVILYRTLGTVGTTTAAFAHESVKPAGRIEQASKLIRSRGRRRFGDDFDAAVGDQIDAVIRAARMLGRWARLPLHLLRRNNRRASAFDLSDVIDEVADVLAPFFEEAHISLAYKRSDQAFPLYGPPAAVEAILMNLVINSITALMQSPPTGNLRTIAIDCSQVSAEYVELTVSDSGPGIAEIDLDEIWLPGRTTREDGTGLGLTIVRDSITDLGGTISVSETAGPLGGAQFTVTFPLMEPA